MSNDRIKSAVAVVLWAAVIFFMSTDVGSSEHTAGFIDPLIRWIVPAITQAGLEHAHFLIRKMGHLTEYAILAILLWRAWTLSPTGAREAWHWKTALLVLLVAATFAVTDEFHQSFVPSRGASARDVAIDTCGAFLGLMLLRICRGRTPVPSNG